MAFYFFKGLWGHVVLKINEEHKSYQHLVAPCGVVWINIGLAWSTDKSIASSRKIERRSYSNYCWSSLEPDPKFRRWIAMWKPTSLGTSSFNTTIQLSYPRLRFNINIYFSNFFCKTLLYCVAHVHRIKKLSGKSLGPRCLFPLWFQVRALWLFIWWPLEAYMVVNFRARGINRGARKLARTPTLN